MNDITDDIEAEFVPANVLNRKKRAVTGGFTYDPTFGTEATSTTTWPKGITEEDARGNCTAKLESTKAKDSCSKLLDTNFTTEIENCIEDVRLTGNMEWIKDVSSTIVTNCESQLTKESSVIPETVKATLETVLCNCENQGTCTKSECVCPDDFAGDTCAINKKETPIVSSPTVCSKDECSVISLSGTNYFNSSTVTCHYTPLLADLSGIRVDSSAAEENVAGNFVTSFNVRCPMSKQKNVQVKLQLKSVKSNTIGVYLTKEVKKCFTSNVTLSVLDTNGISTYFTVKQSCCYIDGKFYTDGEMHPINSFCETCSSKVSKTSWTYLKEKESCQRSNKESNLLVIITSIVAACVLIFIVTFLVIYFAKWKKRKETVNTYRSTLEEDIYDGIHDGSYGFRPQRSSRHLHRSLYA